ncbi:MAG: DegT/DnrJ/EryC1/StrS aminotransferase family protein [bacterium]|nr:DegT/DnrJ/EryC1/StrS aminotransferase family protein [bacterium]
MPVRDAFLVFGSPLIEEPEIREVVDCLRSGWISTGPRVGRFEELFREYAGARHARALGSCSAALHLSMLVSGVREGDEVITTPMTFASTANVITHTGAVPVFADVDRETMTIDPEEVRRRLSPKTRAIIPVHFAGRPCDMDPLMAIARERDLVVIEDAAHAIEAVYRGRKVGSIGDLTCFSFYVTKNIITGEGGMVTTDRDDWAERIEMYGLHGLSRGAWRRYSDEGFRHYEVVYPGYKYNMMDIQAAIGIHQLPRIGRYLGRREEIWRRYDEAFRDLPLATPPPPAPDTVHARHLYTVLLDIDRIGRSRDEIQQALHRENIGTGIHFIAVHLHRYYRERYGLRRGDFPNAEFISDRTISLPLSAKLTDRDVEDVIAAMRKVLA